uniref:Peptidase M13 C-terminal domain-containing protein n=1 Tax=viral metagenome TaxID=1070528 RepID=A0A6C0EQP0_9ZZZZ
MKNTAKKIRIKNKTRKNIKSMIKFVKVPEIKSKCDLIGLTEFEKNYSLYNKFLGKNNVQLKKEFTKELISKFSPTNIKPEEDFYTYINYLWMKDVQLNKEEKYIVQIDDFRLAQDNVYKELDKIIIDYFNSNNNKLSHCLKKFYNSVIKMNNKTDSIKIANDILLQIDELRKNKSNLWKMLAFTNKSQIISSVSPFVWDMLPDSKNPEIFRPYIGIINFPIIDYNIYFDDGTDIEYKKNYRNNFKNYCKVLFDTVLGKDHNMNTDNIYDVQVDIFNSLGCIDITTKPKVYNRVYANESLKKYGFDWEQFSKELGFSKTPKFFITSDLNYLKCGTDLLLENWDSEKWRPYWVWIFIRYIARVTRDFEDIYYTFHGKYQRGQEAIVTSPAVSAAVYMSVPFNTFLTKQYVKKFKDPRIVKYVTTMCNDLKRVFTRIINRNDWLSPSTKKYALLKLKYLDFTIGNPQELREDPLLDYTDSLYDNLNKIYEWRHTYYVQLDGVKVFDIPLVDWTQYPVKLSGRQAYIVNASYTPSKNNIYINLGYMQKPFIDLEERGIQYNLAHLGFTIGHEMSHSLDDQGSQYDHKGRLLNWWTTEDKRRYKLIQKQVINQYEELAKKDGIDFDASIGIGEDLADISGLAICDEYLMDYQSSKYDPVPIRDLSFKAFYTYYAIQMKQKVGKAAVKAQLKTNPHPPDKYRTNVPLSRSQIFRALYNIKKGDGMWWNNTDTIW